MKDMISKVTQIAKSLQNMIQKYYEETHDIKGTILKNSHKN